MIKDIYLQEYNLFLDCFPKTNKRLEQKAMGLEKISDEEKEFIEQYAVRLKKEQDKVNKDELIVYTKIAMSYAIKNKLPYLSLVFHPCSIATRKYYDSEDLDWGYVLFEKIIIWETSQEKTYLAQNELDAVIKHFRSFEK
jgi:hypothetical protein